MLYISIYSLYKAMLKLTNSFYRYLWLTAEYIHLRDHIKKTALNYSRNTCTVSNFSQSVSLLALSTQLDQQQRLFSCKKKQYHPKKQSRKSDASKILNQMSESLQPTVNNVSCGGQFQITPADETQPSTNHWKKNSSAEKDVNKEPLPSDFRRWETVDRRNEKSNGSIKFKVVSYNVLAQYLLECHPYLYNDCSPFDLKWKVRSERLYNEVLKLAPDILCLQEVQESHLSTFYEQFEQLGYHGVFKQKTGQRCDGCAIYFKKSEFHLVDHATVEFYQPELPLLNRDNIGIMVRLVPKSAPDSPLVVATTHLLYNPRRTDVRLAQMQVFLAEIDRFAYYSNGTGRESGHMPIIMTGDFNSTPESVVVRLLDKGTVRANAYRDNSDWKNIEVTDNCQHLSVYLSRQRGYHYCDPSCIKCSVVQELGTRVTLPPHRPHSLRRSPPTHVPQGYAKHVVGKIYNSDYSQPLPPGISRPDVAAGFNDFFNSGVVCHSLQLQSVYDKYKSNGHYEATTFQDCWVTVDYIYFSRKSTLGLLERLRLPTAAECEVLGQLPNEVYASDHLALGAVFEIRPRKCAL